MNKPTITLTCCNPQCGIEFERDLKKYRSAQGTAQTSFYHNIKCARANKFNPYYERKNEK